MDKRQCLKGAEALSVLLNANQRLRIRYGVGPHDQDEWTTPLQHSADARYSEEAFDASPRSEREDATSAYRPIRSILHYVNETPSFWKLQHK